MYGTVARFRAKPGMEAELMKLSQEFESESIPGAQAEYIYRLDSDPNEYYLVVIFESKEAYQANAASSAQDARYRKFRALLEADPKWHDGEIVYANTQVMTT
jgi:quinol monooxygenase YgiN